MNIYESIAAVMSDIGAVGKNSRNTQQGFMFRGIDAVMNAINPALTKYKVFVVPEILDQKREERTNSKGTTLIYSICTVKYTFYAEDGTNVSAVVIGEGMDTGDKATNKAMSIAFKYACFQVFCIPTEEMKDSDADSYEVTRKDPVQADAELTQKVEKETISKVQLKALQNRMANDGVSEAVIKELYKVSDLKDLNIKQYANINDFWEKIKERGIKHE